MDNPHLNPALTGRFKIKHTHLPLVMQSPIGDIDFRRLTEAQAEQLVSKGFYYLERVEQPAAAPEPAPSEATIEPAPAEPAE
jgi:hypothetical protein